jgi:hypothetical protein
VKNLPTIARLMHLRRRREQRALEAVATEMRGLLAAEHSAAAAATALRQQDALADERERALVAPLVGRAVSWSSILRTRGVLDAMALDHARLEAERGAAEAALDRQHDALEVARAAFFGRRRAAMKIDRLFAREAARCALRDEAVAEDAEDRGAARDGSRSDRA